MITLAKKNIAITVDRAAHELRRGRMVVIDGCGFIHPEFVHAQNWDSLKNPKKNPKLIVTANRARAIFGEEFSSKVKIEIPSLDELPAILVGHPSAKPNHEVVEESETLKAAFKLSSIAELLPAVIELDETEGFEISSSEILEFKTEIDQYLELVTEAPLNLRYAKQASVKSFRPANGAAEHLAIIIGELENLKNDEPLIRVHSSCYTGDLLGSLSCDCGDQLRQTIRMMDKEGGGIILYLMQEGRGIGLTNKLRTYHLQADENMDTVEANEFLGFEDEEREFTPAVAMLTQLGIKAVRLVTNNPKKVKGLEELGIKVAKRVPLIAQHKHNEDYLATKAEKSGHIIAS